jgi:hypothetical protein
MFYHPALASVRVFLGGVLYICLCWSNAITSLDYLGKTNSLLVIQQLIIIIVLLGWTS